MRVLMSMETIHGYPIIAVFRLPEVEGLRTKRQVILVDKGREFVVALHCRGDKEWIHGHYFDNAKEARAKFYERAEFYAS